MEDKYERIIRPYGGKVAEPEDYQGPGAEPL
jgi:hypothetical protein